MLEKSNRPKFFLALKTNLNTCALELERDVWQQVYFNLKGDAFFIANTDEELVAGPYLLY